LGMQQCMYQCLIGIGCGRFVCYDESYCVGTTSSQFSILEFLMLVGLSFVVDVICLCIFLTSSRQISHSHHGSKRFLCGGDDRFPSKPRPPLQGECG